MKGLVITYDQKGEPTGITLDGTPVCAESLDIIYRGGEPAKVVIELYVKDIEGGVIARGPDGEAITETREFYAVSKKDHELLMQLKKKDTL
jgi:hypothetical protein